MSQRLRLIFYPFHDLLFVDLMTTPIRYQQYPVSPFSTCKDNLFDSHYQSRHKLLLILVLMSVPKCKNTLIFDLNLKLLHTFNMLSF